MDAKEEARLLKLYEDVDSDEYSLTSEGTEPFVDSDVEYAPSAYSADDSDADCNNVIVDNLGANEAEGHNAEPGVIENGSPSNEDSDNGDENNPVDYSEWDSDISDILDFSFDANTTGVKLVADQNSTPIEIFRQIWHQEIMDLLVTSTNNYGKALTIQSRPKTRNSRSVSFRDIDSNEMNKFLGLCLLQGQLNPSSIRKLFSLDPLNYHPIFPCVMSGRRFEQILRSFSANDPLIVQDGNRDRLSKVRAVLNLCISKFQAAYSPAKELSLDESLLLFRGRLMFRTYMKNKKTKYGIKFYELCSPNGYVLNLEIYKGHDEGDS